MSGKHNLQILQGSTFRVTFTLEEMDSDSNLTAANLVGCLVRMQIRPNHRSTEVYLDLGLEGYISISDPQNGEIFIEIPASVTEELDFSSAVYDIEIEYPDGFVLRMVEGKVNLSLEVTK